MSTFFALEGLVQQFLGNHDKRNDIKAAANNDKHLSWWPATSAVHPCESISSPPPSSAPQHLWPRHKLPGDSLPTPKSPDTNDINLNCTAKNNSAEQQDGPSKLHPHPLRPLYAGIFLAGPSTLRVLHRARPRHATVYAHHLTVKYFGYEGDPIKDVHTCLKLPIGQAVAIGVVGVATNEYAQALQVTLPSWLPYHNSALPHVTISVVEGGEAKEAGVLVATAATAGEVHPVHGLRVLHGVVGVCLTDRSVVYSEEALREAVENFENSNCVLLERKSTCMNNYNEISGQIGSDKEEIDLVALMHQCMQPVEANQQGQMASINESAAVYSSKRQPMEQQEAQISLAIGNNSSNRNSPLVTRHQKSKESRRPTRSQSTAQHSRERKKASNTSTSTSGTAAWWKGGTSVRPSHHKQTAAESENISFAAGYVSESESESSSKLAASTVAATASAAAAVARAQQLVAAESEREAMHAHHAAYKAAKEAHYEAKAEGDSRTALAYAAGAHKHAAAVVSARRRASAVAFSAHNSSLVNTFKVDLHGMHVKEAVDVLRRYIEGLSAVGHPGGVLLRVVTGFGQHSAQGRAKVLPAVIEFLQESGLLFDMEEDNPGAIRVLVEPQ